jgi:hypothetical protein
VLAGDGRASVPELLKICDNGLLMGCPVLDNILAKIAHHLHILHSPDSETAAPNYSLKPLNSELESFINRKSMPSLPGPQFVVPSEELPSLELFSTKYFQPEKPVLLKGTIRHWPAMEKWSPEYIVKVHTNSTLLISISPLGLTNNVYFVRLLVQELFLLKLDRSIPPKTGLRS